MALIECLECKKEIADTATSCPHCGAEVIVPGILLSLVAGILFPTAMGIGTLIMSAVRKHEQGQVLFIDFLPFIAMTIVFYYVFKWQAKQYKNYGYMLKDKLHKFWVYLLFLPTWAVYVLSFFMALSPILVFLLGDLAGSKGFAQATLLIFGIIFYKPFLKVFKYI
ncbi:MAG: zinc ribbon domain-containing protein [Arcobacteraceae bacterium]|nr:zinc ribbon domain-containing protein [Arcobacteraceae bacterium]